MCSILYFIYAHHYISIYITVSMKNCYSTAKDRTFCKTLFISAAFSLKEIKENVKYKYNH